LPLPRVKDTLLPRLFQPTMLAVVMLVRLALTAIFLLAAALRLWRLDQNGFGNEYYTAG